MSQNDTADARDPRQMLLRSVEIASLKIRHSLVAFSFVLCVILPLLLTAFYLYVLASDRYVSEAGFSIRTNEAGSAIEMLGGIAELSNSSTSDPEILYNYIQSPELVRAIDAKLDLRTLWAKGNAVRDPIFVYHAPGTIEDLTKYWRRMVKVYSTDNGILQIEVQAFTPEDAQLIAEEIFAESSAMINRLSAIAREDSTGYARDELETAVERLKAARSALTRFRNRTQIIDPTTSVQNQMGLLSSMQLQLAQALIDYDMLLLTSKKDDPRAQNLDRRIAVIRARIEDERRKVGIGSPTEIGQEAVFADLVGQFEELSVDQQFAEQAYTSALAAFDAAQAEARRKSRYLAAFVNPTLPEVATRPQRITALMLTGLFLFVLWSIAVLAIYAVRERR